MQKSRAPGKKFIPTRFIDYFEAPYPKQVLVAKTIAQSEKGLTIDALMCKTAASRESVRNTVVEMHKLKFVYISHWVKVNKRGHAAAYAIGNKEDAEKPRSERAIKEALRRQQLTNTETEKPDTKLVTYYKSLAKALAPKRKPDEQRKVNSMYLNWISGGVYGNS